jgi:hypothetical protein
MGEARQCAWLRYDPLLEYWQAHILHKHPYYWKLRRLADQFGLRGPILWTELVKCESRILGKEKVSLSVVTIREDVNKHLFKEVALMPKDWPLIGVSHTAYEILSYRFPQRLVIGVPHATASYGHFGRLFAGRILKAGYKRKVRVAIKSRQPVSISLFNS